MTEELTATPANRDLDIALGPLQARELIVIALQHKAGIDIIERLAVLQREAQALQAETEFNEAFNRVQSQIDAVKPDLRNSQTGSKYASYAALDREVRPLYTREGFSLSFDEAESSKPDHIRVVAYLRRGSHKETFRKDMAINTKGIKGNEMMTITHAEGSANTYGKRYLLGNIWNIPVGEGLAPDDDGNLAGQGNPEGALVDLIVSVWCDRMRAAETFDNFKRAYFEAFSTAQQAGLSKAQMDQLSEVKEEVRKKFPENGGQTNAPSPGN